MNMTNPKQQYGDRKVPLHLVPVAAIIYLARAFKEGARKYGAYNWRKTQVETNTYIGAALRHIYAYAGGENIDPESGNPHIAHALACLAILADAKEGGNLIDNRHYSSTGADMMRAYEAEVKANENQQTMGQAQECTDEFNCLTWKETKIERAKREAKAVLQMSEDGAGREVDPWKGLL